MRKDYEKLFSYIKPPEPAPGLFDRIILAIKREQELQHTKRLLFGFLFLLVASFVATPLSWTMLVNQTENSGILYFISTAVSDLGTFFSLWHDFGLAIAESLADYGHIGFFNKHWNCSFYPSATNFFIKRKEIIIRVYFIKLT